MEFAVNWSTLDLTLYPTDANSHANNANNGSVSVESLVWRVSAVDTGRHIQALMTGS